MVEYSLKIKKNEVKALHKYGFTNVHPFKSRSWRIGVEKDQAYRRYYIAYKGNKQCFIKVAVNDSTIGNEITVAEQLMDKNIPFISEIISYDRQFMDSKQMLATEFAKGLHFISEESVYNDVEKVTPNQLLDYCKQMLAILETLEAINLIHADIHKGNLMLDSNNKLLLLDFGISKFIDKKNEVNYRLRPGTFYRETADGRVYDDAYSFIKLINRYDSCSEIKESDVYKKICSRIDKVKFCVKI